MKTLTENLKLKNLKVTPQRLAVYSYLFENKTHPSAETIYTHIKEIYPAISLSTVYKTLKSLKDANLIQEINLGEDSFRYDIATEPHSHVICNKCNSIIDYYFDQNIISQFNSSIMRDTNFSVSKQQLFFYGICKDCASENN